MRRTLTLVCCLGVHEQNSRISFKLFDKHPGQFPEGLRSQVSVCWWVRGRER